MRYADNQTKGVVNGVIFYFEEGDEQIATDVFEIVNGSERPPTSVVWNGECLTSAEALHRLQTDGLTEDEWLGIRLTIDELPLLREVLDLFTEDYPALGEVVAEIEGKLFMTRH